MMIIMTFQQSISTNNIIILSHLAGLGDAVCGHDDGAWELCKLKLLQLPRTAVIAHQMLVLVKCWIAVRGQLQ